MSNTNLLGYFFEAGLVVKSVMLILFITSIVSWALMFQRFWYFKKIKEYYNIFCERFRRCSDLNNLYKELDAHLRRNQGLSLIFYAGYNEYLRSNNAVNYESIKRAMQINQAKEVEDLEKHLSLFASIGSIAPYIGLFGTVWGIMTSFQALGHADHATIAMVAPGISEALVATALGLFTAIPAVIAYNRFSSAMNFLLERYNRFQEEFIALLNNK